MSLKDGLYRTAGVAGQEGRLYALLPQVLQYPHYAFPESGSPGCPCLVLFKDGQYPSPLLFFQSLHIFKDRHVRYVSLPPYGLKVHITFRDGAVHIKNNAFYTQPAILTFSNATPKKLFYLFSLLFKTAKSTNLCGGGIPCNISTGTPPGQY